MIPALRFHRDLDRLPAAARGTVAAIGNFDGVHLGHRAVIAAAADAAARQGAALSVVTFEPHPRRFFKPDAPPFRLASVRRKLELLAECGVAHVFALRFNAALAAHSADAFVDEILLARLDLAAIVAGWDFAFGRGRGGTTATLVSRMAQAGRAAHIVAAATIEDAADGPANGAPNGAAVYSSTAVRAALAAGDPQRAARLLGRPYAIDGHVRSGAKRGRTIGFPTANLGLGAHVPPAFGVYAVRVEGAVPGQRVAGVANLGVRPTVGGGLAPQLEAHLFDFSGDLYGRRVRVAFEAFLRPEQKFADFAALKEQIVRDAAAARKILG